MAGEDIGAHMLHQPTAALSGAAAAAVQGGGGRHVSSVGPPHPHYSFSLPRPPLPSITSTLSNIRQSINALNILHFLLRRVLFGLMNVGVAPKCAQPGVRGKLITAV